MTIEGLVQRGTSIARGLGFAFLTYFLTAFLRDVASVPLAGGGLAKILGGPTTTGLAVLLLISAVTVGLSGFFVRLYSRTGPDADRPVPLLRLRGRWWREWGRGTLIGAGLATATVIPMLLAHQTEILGLARGFATHPAAVLAAVGVLALEAAREELGFRGPAQRELTRAVSFPVAATFLSASFAIIHSGNPAVDKAGLTSIFIAGMALAGLARARGDLGMVCGVHAGWNVMLGMVWSLPVSGVRLHSRLLVTSSTHSLWTGGSFGAEGSGPAMVVLLLFAIGTWSLPPCPAADPAAGPATGDASGSA